MDNIADTRRTDRRSFRPRPTSRLRSGYKGGSSLVAMDVALRNRFAGNAHPATRGQARWFAALAGTASLAILVQAVIAGQFVSQPGNHGWIFAHGVISWVTLGATLAAAIFAIAALRRTERRLTILAGGLFLLTVIQTIIGYLITVAGQDGWIGVHVPLAFVIFGLTAWLSFKAAVIARASRSGLLG